MQINEVCICGFHRLFANYSTEILIENNLEVWPSFSAIIFIANFWKLVLKKIYVKNKWFWRNIAVFCS